MNPCPCDPGTRLAVSALTAVRMVAVLLLCACTCQTACRPKELSVEERSAGEKAIEHFLRIELPASATHCRSHSISQGWGGGICWGYFEVPPADLSVVLTRSGWSFDLSEFEPNDAEGAWHRVDRYTEAIPWWRPWELKDARYARRCDDQAAWVWQLGLCMGQTQTGRSGVYFIYHCD